MTEPAPVRLAEYAPPDFLIDTVDLTFELDPQATVVRARLAVRRNPLGKPDAPLALDGEALTLLRVAIDGAEIGANRYTLDDHGLAIADMPESCTLDIETRISPATNTELSGLYQSGDNFFTQCEAQGFRRITYFLDRPDVMSRYTTTIVADPHACPVLLSNGNPAGRETRADGRSVVRWVDPHPKPSYLFALVAGDLVSFDDRFTTRSGRKVDLHIWVRAGDEDRCEHAMRSLKSSMVWDEQTYGLEYDLDVFNIAAVSDFNMGAMENKGLNVFNSKYVLARPETATDGDYMGIETVIAHEYFHNWTGNRITCRDWFQLSLKEGLTVFRDQEFSADQGSRAVKRISDVRGLRAGQFTEDSGPLAHPVRPESYLAIDNFYTATVYQKGAEVVRMIRTIIGHGAFRRGMDLYVARHDNQAVTIEDFVRCMADASGADFSQFARWYKQAGTPVVTMSDAYDAAARRYTLTLRQDVPPTPGQPDKRPMPIPVATGLLDPAGHEIATQMLMLTDREQSFVFDGVVARPVPSLLRGFSAPVKLRGVTSGALQFLAAHDTDPFVRWDSLQQYATDVLLERIAHPTDAPLDVALIDAYAAILDRATDDPALAAASLSLPSQSTLGEQMEIDDVDAIAVVQRGAFRDIARALEAALRRTHAAMYRAEDAARIDGEAIGRRTLKNACLTALAEIDPDFAVPTAMAQFERAETMTDVLAALGVLADIECPERTRALKAFHAQWRGDALVLDKWFSVQALSRLPSARDDVAALTRHADFDLGNPNRVRSLVGAFSANRVSFHGGNGAGYRLYADTLLTLDPRNAQLAARMVPALGRWRRFDAGRKAALRGELERIRAAPGLSRNTLEMVSRSLA